MSVDLQDNIATPPAPRMSNCLPLASVQVDDNAFIFYYNGNDNLLHMATGRENTGWPTTPIQVGGQNFKVNAALQPLPITAGYDPTRKEIHVFFVQAALASDTPYLMEIISNDLGYTWKIGSLGNNKKQMTRPIGALSCVPPGGTPAIWRVFYKAAGSGNTFDLLYEITPDNWAQFPLP